MIRSYFHRLDLDPSFRIGDEGEIKLLKKDVVQELLEEHYKEKQEDFLQFVEAYAAGKSDRGLEDLILKLYEFSTSFPYPERWLQSCTAGLEGRRKKEKDGFRFCSLLPDRF